MTGTQTFGLALTMGYLALAAVGLRGVIPVLVLTFRRVRWEKHSAVVTTEDASRDWVMSRRGPDYPASRHGYAGMVPEELGWFITYTYVISHHEYRGRSRQRALPPPVVGATVPILVHPRSRRRSRFDEPETSAARLVLGALAMFIAGRLLMDSVPLIIG